MRDSIYILDCVTSVSQKHPQLCVHLVEREVCY